MGFRVQGFRGLGFRVFNRHKPRNSEAGGFLEAKCSFRSPRRYHGVVSRCIILVLIVIIIMIVTIIMINTNTNNKMKIKIIITTIRRRRRIL